jgi:hypothetical protein
MGVSNAYSELTLYNNIFYLAVPGDVAINQEMDELLSNHNIFYPERDGFIAVGNNTYSTLSELQKQKGLDMNSFNNDPLFVDVYNDNFDLKDGSPAINTGRSVGLEHDFIGNRVPLGGAPDIGIIEKSVPLSNEQDYSSESDENVFSIYPNPSNGEFYVSCNEIKGHSANVSIKDLTGRTLYESTCYPSDNKILHFIDLPDLKKGLYVILLEFSGELYSQRLLRMD